MIKRTDTLKPWLQFRDSDTGKWVTRLYAFKNPKTTQSHRRWRKDEK